MKDKRIPEQALLARNLKRAREQSGLSQQELADRAGLDRTYLSNLERGIGNPSLIKMASLSTALSMSVSHMLTPDEDRNDHEGQPALREIAAVLKRNGVI